METLGNHARVFHYDGAFKCLDCQTQWGALSDPEPQMPEECVKSSPKGLYVWLVPSEHVLEQPGSWRIRKWDTEPFPEANYALELQAHATEERK